MSFKRMLGLSGLLGVLAAAAMAVPAQAEVKAVCVVIGTAKTSPAVLLTGGKGSFTFEDIALHCVGVAKGAPAVGGYTVSAAGTFKNVVCGTGKAIGTVTALAPLAKAVLPPGPDVGDKVVNKKFAVEFVGTQGQFYWHDGDWAKPVLPTKVLDPLLEQQKPSTAKTWALAGSVSLLPPVLPPGKTPVIPPPPGECTKAFSVVGDVVIDTGPHA